MRVAACKGALPFDVAFSADDDFVLAWIIARGENEGWSFNWKSGSWIEPKK